LINVTLFSASKDQTAVLWKWNIDNNSVESVYTCKGHERALEAVGINAARNLMATGSWDTMLKIWSTCKAYILKIYLFIILELFY